MNKTTFSIRKLATESGIDRATVTKICAGITEMDEARAAIAEWRKVRSESTSPIVDPETGLSWFQAKMREEVLQKRADRVRELQMSGGDLVPVSVVETAAQVAGNTIQQLAVRLYAAGIADSPRLRSEVERLTKEASTDLLNYVRQHIERQTEIAKEQNKK